MSIVPKAEIPAVLQFFYPIFPSLAEAVAYAKGELPEVPENTLMRVLGVYHNSLITVLKDQRT